MQNLLNLSAKTVISAGILSLCFIQSEIQKLYKNLLSPDGITGLKDDLLYVDNGIPVDCRNIYNTAKSLLANYDDPCKLLSLLESSKPELRQKGFQRLAENGNWNEYQCRHIAQTCSHRTTVSLARMKDVDTRFFRPMPKILDIEITNPLQRKEPNDSFQSNEIFLDEAVDDSKEYDKHKTSLIHLTVDTLIVEKSIEFVEGAGLPYLQYMFMKYPSDLSIHRLIACVLANLSVITSLHSNIIHGGWALVLHQWMTSDDIRFYFHSSRALANLDKDWETDIRVEAVYADGVFLGHPVYRTSHTEEHETMEADIVFIHGLEGGPFKTWRQKDKDPNEIMDKDTDRTVFWPKDWLVHDLYSNVRVLNVGFDAASSYFNKQTVRDTTRESLIETGSTLLRKLQQADIGSRPIIWVGHSMGGLLIKEILFIAETDPKFKQFSVNTEGVVFYSTPHKGSRLASLAKYLFPLMPTQAVKDLMYGNVYLMDLHKSFLFMVLKYNIPCLSFGEGDKTDLGLQLSLKIVESESADPGVGDFYEVPYNHINTCKPESKESLVYKHTLSFINNCVRNIHRNNSKQK